MCRDVGDRPADPTAFNLEQLTQLFLTLGSQLAAAAPKMLLDPIQERLNDFVFPGVKRDKPLSDMALLMLLRELHPGITVHGFRSTFKDWAAETTTFPDFLSEMALAEDRDIPLIIFDISQKDAMVRAAKGEHVGTLVHS